MMTEKELISFGEFALKEFERIFEENEIVERKHKHPVLMGNPRKTKDSNNRIIVHRADPELHKLIDEAVQKTIEKYYKRLEKESKKK